MMWTVRVWQDATDVYESTGRAEGKNPQRAEIEARADAVRAIMRGARKVEIFREEEPVW